MSGLWTPGGENQPPPKTPQQPQPTPGPAGPSAQGGAPDPERTAAEAQIADLQRQLANTPAAVVVANHCFGLFELAALHLSSQPPKLPEAQLAIDAMAALVEGLAGRLGEPEAQMKEGLSQLRMAYVNIAKAASEPN